MRKLRKKRKKRYKGHRFRLTGSRVKGKGPKKGTKLKLIDIRADKYGHGKTEIFGPDGTLYGGHAGSTYMGLMTEYLEAVVESEEYPWGTPSFQAFDIKLTYNEDKC